MTHRFRTTKQATTTARGYGLTHQRERARRLPLHTPTDPCGYCGQPLGPNRKRWHLPHNPTRTAYLPGFWHDVCNQREAAIRGGRKALAMRRAGRQVTRRRLLG